MAKATYKITNWKEYNQALVNRGNLTLWVSEETIAQWYAEKVASKKGPPFVYSDLAIETGLTLRSLFHLPLRQTQGFLTGFMSLMMIDVRVPDYSTFCRRASGLKIDLGYLKSSKSIDVVVDASGLKVYGEGEWKVRTHGKGKRRTWRKLHISVDAATQEIVAVSLTKSNVHDSLEMKNLLPEEIDIQDVGADKAYDNFHAYDPIAAKNAKATIPPRSGAALTKNPSPGMKLRNNNIREKWKWGTKMWKQGRRYHKRSLVETAFCRYKKTFGERMQTKTLANQRAEVRLKAKILNELTHLGMPKTVKIL